MGCRLFVQSVCISHFVSEEEEEEEEAHLNQTNIYPSQKIRQARRLEQKDVIVVKD